MTNRLKLFALRTKSGLLKDDDNSPIWFSDKRQAKAARDEYNQSHSNPVVVTFGIDHKRYKGAK